MATIEFDPTVADVTVQVAVPVEVLTGTAVQLSNSLSFIVKPTDPPSGTGRTVAIYVVDPPTNAGVFAASTVVVVGLEAVFSDLVNHMETEVPSGNLTES